VAKAEGILRLLLVDDSLTEADNVTNTLRSTGHAVRASRQDSLSGIEEALTNQAWDLIICRAALAAVPPRELVNFVSRLGKDLPCIVLTSSQDDIEELYDIGAQDIIPISDGRRLQFAVERELQNLFHRRLARRNERALRESEKRSRLLLESSRDAVAYMHEGMHIYVNTAYLALFGFEDADDISGLPILDMITVDDHARFKSIFRQFSEQVDSEPQTVSVQCVKADSSVFRAQIEFSHAEVEGEDCTQVVIRDELEHDNLDTELKLLRDRDFLTNLYSRVRFVDELEKTAGKAGTGKGDSALLYLVIDDFQSIKEKFGLGSSDLIIKEVADLLRKEAADTDLIARYSDQVFTIIVNSDDDAYVKQRAESYRNVIANYVSQTSSNDVDLQCSIGISRISEKLSTVDAILNDADKACVQAQHAGGNQVTRLQTADTESDDNAVKQTSEWEVKLQDALKNNDFSLHFQPIVSLHGREQQLYEVLVRLFDQKGDLLWPDKFFQYADHFKMMDELDQWVITNSLQRLAQHQQKFPKTRFFIKLTKQTLCKEDFVDWLCGLLKENGLEGDSLVFEISETEALENLEHAKETVAKLKQVGCEFGLEHFGSGLDFSATLDSLDVDYLKINGTFVQNMAKDSENQAAVKAIIEMSKNAGKSSIAEFVSDANSLALLWRLGVDYAQGYYIHEPSEALDYNFEDDD